MESELEIASSLMSPPTKDIVALSKAQLGFMNMFAIPLFQGVADIMPTMRYCVDELEANKTLFERGVAEEQAKQDPERRLVRDGTLSPRTMSIAVTPGTDKEPVVGRGAPSPAASKPAGCSSGISPQAASPTSKPSHLPDLNYDYQEVNGIATRFDNVADFAASDPFNVHDARHFASDKQRCSEATDGSASVPGTGDWASQATSATTSKMPLSPSTQGTSIISQDSQERPSSVPVTNITAPDSAKSRSDPRIEPRLSPEDGSSLSSNGNGKSPDGKALKKKPSRFRMNLNLFRRHKGTSPPMPAADTTTA